MRWSSSWSTVSRSLLLALTFALLLVYFLRPEYGIDIFWHMKAGEHILDAGAFPTTDIFAYQHPERDWVTFEWLYQVGAHALHEWGGFMALRVVNVLLLTLGFALAFRLAYLLLERRFDLAWLLLVVLSVLYHDRIRIRPHVFNLVFLLMVARPLLTGFRGLDRRGWLALVGVGILWGNIHAGGVNVMIVMWGVVFGAGLIERLRLGETSLPLKPMFLWGLALAAGLALSPNYIQGNVTALTMFNATKLIIPEWHVTISYLGQGTAPHFLICGLLPYLLVVPVALQGAARALELDRRGTLAAVGAFALLFGLLMLSLSEGEAVRLVGRLGLYAALPGLVALVIIRLRRPDELPAWALALTLLYLSHLSARFVYLAVLPLLTLIRWNLPRLATFRARPVLVALLGLALLGTTVHYFFYVQRRGVAHAMEMLRYDVEPTRFPELAGDFLEESGASGRVFNQTEWGGYLLFRLFPEAKVFSDGRGNLDNDELVAVIETHKPFNRARALGVTDRLYGFDLTVFERPTFPESYWDHARYLRVYNDPEVDIFLRRSAKSAAMEARMIRYYEARGVAAPDLDDEGSLVAFERAVARHGWGRWLERPFNRQRVQRLEARATSERPREQQRGHLGLARVMIHADLLDEASQHVNEVLARFPFHARALVLGAQVRYLQGRFDEVEGPLQMALLLDGFPTYGLLGKRYSLNGKEKRLAQALMDWNRQKLASLRR
jgi:hypothetical protein